MTQSTQLTLLPRSACAKALAGLVVAVGVSLVGGRAAAQEYLIGGSFEAASGVEGGGSDEKLGVRRARTQLRVGADLRVDETPKDALGFGLLADIEPHRSVGVDARYMRILKPSLVVYAGAIGFLMPETYLGLSGGLQYRRPLSKGFDLVAGPAFQVFFLGSDLPTSQPIWQLQLSGGIRVDL